MDIVVKIAPKVAANWEDIGYCLKLKDEDMENIEEDVTISGDTRSASKKVMKTWIRCIHDSFTRVRY